MALNSDNLAALEAALAKGEKRVTFGDKTVEYRSVEELKDAVREVRKAIARAEAADGTAPMPARHIRVTTSKGF